MTTATNRLKPEPIAGIVFAAGKGSRMKGYDGNKTLLPLIPRGGLYQGERPLLLEVLANLPAGPKAIVINHHGDEVRAATAHLQPDYLPQPTTNGTGGALLAARPFLDRVRADRVIITMGDVPLVKAATYQALLEQLRDRDLMVLAFDPADMGQYGRLEWDEDRLQRITEWKYWRDYAPPRLARLRYCNAGIYAARRPLLLEFMTEMEHNPHRVEKERNGAWVVIEEYFLTDLVEFMARAGRSVGALTVTEEEVTGVDTPEALRTIQARYAERGPRR